MYLFPGNYMIYIYIYMYVYIYNMYIYVCIYICIYVYLRDLLLFITNQNIANYADDTTLLICNRNMNKMLKMVYKLKIHVGGGLICNKTTVDLLGMAGDSKRSF